MPCTNYGALREKDPALRLIAEYFAHLRARLQRCFRVQIIPSGSADSQASRTVGPPRTRRLSEALPVDAASDQDVCGVDM